MYVTTLYLSCGVTAEITRTWLMQAQPDGERVMRRVTGYHLTDSAVSAIALVYVLDGEPMPAELSDDDICPPQSRSAGALKRAWRELVARLTTTNNIATHMHLEFFELPREDYVLRSQTFPVCMAGATRAYLLCMPCVTLEAVCVSVHDPDHAGHWQEHHCLCDYTFNPKTGEAKTLPSLYDGDEEAYVWSLRLLASDAAARRRLIQLCEDMKH